MLSATQPHRLRPGRAPAPPFSDAERRLAAAGASLLLLWTLAALLAPLVAPGPGLLLLPSSAGAGSGGSPAFADGRTLWGLPNAMDVLSNLPFLLGGVWGLWQWRMYRLQGPAAKAAAVFLLGLVATAVGSSVFHAWPGEPGLALDRAGMAVAFAGALGLAAAERVSARAAGPVLGTTLVLALLSAVMPLTHGNVVPWAVVQFGGMALMVGLALQHPANGALGIRIGALIAWYALAKAFELLDAEVFHFTGHLVSGHTLKHLVAACAVWPVLRALRQNAPALAPAQGGQPTHRSTPSRTSP